MWIKRLSARAVPHAGRLPSGKRAYWFREELMNRNADGDTYANGAIPKLIKACGRVGINVQYTSGRNCFVMCKPRWNRNSWRKAQCRLWSHQQLSSYLILTSPVSLIFQFFDHKLPTGHHFLWYHYSFSCCFGNSKVFAFKPLESYIVKKYCVISLFKKITNFTK